MGVPLKNVLILAVMAWLLALPLTQLAVAEPPFFAAAYRAAQGALVASAPYDDYQSAWGLDHTLGHETGEASWYFRDPTAPENIGVLTLGDAVCLLAAHRAARAHSPWLRWGAVVLLAGRAVIHIHAGRSWSALPIRP